MKILITGGAGFIGRYVAEALDAAGHQVVVFDNLDRQSHPDLHDAANAKPVTDPSYGVPDFPPDLPGTHVYGDICHDADVYGALEAHKPDIVIHLAAKVGVGQSATNPDDYVMTNAYGTALLLKAMQDTHKPARLIVASSMSCYGEGLYFRQSDMRLFRPGLRVDAHMEMAVAGKARWEHPALDIGYESVGIGESNALAPTSIYAESKATTERMALIWGEQQGVPVAALRFFNVYGRRQSPRNPYTGVVAMFGSAALRGEAPVVYEDGLQSRDFVHVLDVAGAIRFLSERPEPAIGPFNVCTGIATTIGNVAQECCEIACVVKRAADGPEPRITGAFRPGDVRHCIGDGSRLRALGWTPQITFRDGLSDVITWMATEQADGATLTPIADPHAELRDAGLLRE